MARLGAPRCNYILCDVYLELQKPTYRHFIPQFIYQVERWMLHTETTDYLSILLTFDTAPCKSRSLQASQCLHFSKR